MSELKQYFDTTPKSFSGTTKYELNEHWSPESNPFNNNENFFGKREKIAYPVYKRRTDESNDIANKTDFIINHSPFDSDNNVDQDDNSSVRFSDCSNPRSGPEHPYFNLRNGKNKARKMVLSNQREPYQINKKIPANNFPIVKNANPKTSFE